MNTLVQVTATSRGRSVVKTVIVDTECRNTFNLKDDKKPSESQIEDAGRIVWLIDYAGRNMPHIKSKIPAKSNIADLEKMCNTKTTAKIISNK